VEILITELNPPNKAWAVLPAGYIDGNVEAHLARLFDLHLLGIDSFLPHQGKRDRAA